MVAEIFLSAHLHVPILHNFRNIQPNRKHKKNVKLLDDQNIYHVYVYIKMYFSLNENMYIYVFRCLF